SKEEIEKMKNEAKANEDADKKVREKVEKMNMADGLIFNTEKQLSEFGDKIPADEKSKIEDAVNKLKEAHKSEDLDAIDKAMEELNTAWQTASQHIYNDQQQAGSNASENSQQQGGQNSDSSNDGNVTDAEFEEVK